MSKTTRQNKKSKLISDVKNYAMGLYISKFFTFPCGIITARLLGPFFYGTWQAVKIVLLYTPRCQLGISTGIKREVPLLRGQGKLEEIELIKESASNAVSLISVIVLLCIFGATFFLGDSFSPLVVLGLRVVAFVAFFRLSTDYCLNLLEAQGQFNFVIKLRIFKNIFAAILQVALVIWFGLYGLYAAVFITAMLVFLYLRNKLNIGFNLFSIKVPVLKKVMKSGIPMVLSGTAHTLFYSTDRLLIVALLGSKALGIYSIALFVATFLEFIPTALFQVLLPNTMKKIGKDKSVLDSVEIWFKPAFVLSNMMPIFVGIVWICTPICIHYLLPKYVGGIEALKVLSVSVYFLALVSVYKIFFIGLDKHYPLIGIYLVLIAVNVGLDFWFIRQGMGIFGVALATVTSCFLLSNVLLCYVQMHHDLLLYEKIKFGVSINLPVFYIIALLLFFDNIWVDGTVPHISIVLGKLVLFLICSVPLLYRVHTRTGVIAHFLPKKKVLTER